jgi:hypothetical protein
MEPIMSINSTEAIKHAALSVRDEVRRGDLGILQVEDPRIERELYTAWLKGRTSALSTQAFFDLVLTAAAE